MAYCVQNDLLEQISENDLLGLSDDAGAGVVDAGVIARAIADADAEIDGYCGTRYDVPFATVPALIRKMSVEIAIYNLYARRFGADESRKSRYGAIVRTLRDISKGMISLGVNAPAEDNDAGPEASTDIDDRVFSTGRKSNGSVGSLDNY